MVAEEASSKGESNENEESDGKSHEKKRRVETNQKNVNA
jgi:hypothetical protein